MTPKQTTEALYAHFAAHDNEALRQLMHPEIEWRQMEGFPGGGTFVGPDAIFEGVFGRFPKEWDGFQAVIERIFTEGEQVLCLGYYAGTHKETGRYMKARLAHHYTVRGGLVVRFEQFTDTLLIARAMGVAGNWRGGRQKILTCKTLEW